MGRKSPNSCVEDFEELVLTDNWDEVIESYKKDKFYHTLKVKKRGTALHVAVSNGEEKAVKELVRLILSMWNDDDDDDNHPLSMWNERGGTPLHIAALRGFTSMCECIIGKNGERKDLVRMENDNGETPLLWAVLGQRKKTFVYLYQFAQRDVNIVMDKNGTTILHYAIRRDMFGLANIIMHCYASSSISFMKDKNGVTPLEELATRTSAFKSGNPLSWWKQILYYCFPLKPVDPATKLESIQKIVNRDKDDHAGDISIQLNDDDELEKENKARLWYRSIFKWPIISLFDLEKIEIIKKKRLYAAQLLEEFMKNPYYSYGGGGDEAPLNTEHAEEIQNIKGTLKKDINKEHEKEIEDIKGTLEEGELQNTTEESGIAKMMQQLISKLPITSDKKGILLEAVNNIEAKSSAEKIDTKDTTYLVAAKHGIVEITSALESTMKSVIHERNSNNENALLLAVKYRQPQIVEQLQKSLSSNKKIFQSLCLKVDNNENTMLHLAAYTSLNKETTWRISGPAMQMMWDIKWYKYIKGIVPEYFRHRINKEKKTPGEVFKEEHKELLQSSTEWLRDTAESCSVVAALIAGLSFATSGSVPGGNNDSGKPPLEGQPAFEGFAISSLIGLYFSGTALIMFLSILTSRKQIEDFNINLPTKLLAGLTSLFVSIVAMFISFCAGHFFVLTDKYGKHDILFYLYIVFSFPVIFYAAVQLPLYIDLLKVIWKKVPPPSIKGVHL
ncbi:hypothetical protein QL285_061094 [Trifolium repens]|nr:hypothetical protein QL285_061094 [Trifolium repens]